MAAFKEEIREQLDDMQQQNQAQMDSVDNNFLRESDPRMPLFSDKKSKVTFGSGS